MSELIPTHAAEHAASPCSESPAVSSRPIDACGEAAVPVCGGIPVKIGLSVEVKLSAPTPAPTLTLTEFLPRDERGTIHPSFSERPGPGLPEALAWTVGVFSAHICAGIIGIIAVVAMMLSTGEDLNSLSDFQSWPGSYHLLMLGLDQWGVLALTVAAIWVRWSGQIGPRLNLTALRPLHVAVIAGMVLPLSTVSGEVYRVVQLAWRPLVERMPLLELLDQSNAVEMLQQLSHAGPLPVMVLVIAVAPALAEELLFRGLIGRGLVARWGVVGGVAITSALFAAVHFHPVHALAVLPIGIVLHYVYLTTRSFWGPVLLHFLNNAWATVAALMFTPPEVTAKAEAAVRAAAEAPAGPVLLWSSLVAVIVLGTLLYRTRTRYLLPNGEEWTPGYTTAELPPIETGAQRASPCETGRNLLTAGTAWMAFTIAFVAEIAAHAR